VAEDEFAALFTGAGCQGWLWAGDIDGEGTVTAGADELVTAASVFKVAVALEACRQAAEGRIDAGQRIRVPTAGRTPGPTGLSVFADEAELSVRDLTLMMLTVSDNAATDVLIDLVGLDSVHATLRSLGLSRTTIPWPLRDELDSIGQDAGFGGWADLDRAAATFSPTGHRQLQESFQRARALDPPRSIRTTPRELGLLLRLIWRDQAGPPQACAQVRQMLGHQVTRQRLALGFPRDGTQVAAKSGSLLGIVRNEAGVITLPGGRRYAVAVFTRADRPHDNEHAINAAIGTAAALAIKALSRT
jgi:beta-lactamase class A